MSTVEIKDFIDPSSQEFPRVDANGVYDWTQPDISMALPFVGADGNAPNGAVWPWRLSLGAEDDPNRAKVYKWVQVDDLGGISPLWAGIFNGTIYLHAGAQAPAAATDDNTDATGTPVAGEDDAWHNGEPVLPFVPVEMDARETVLKSSGGKWRRLYWEAVALFDIQTSKNPYKYNEAGERTGHNLRRHTLYMVVEHPYVVFYSTAADLDDATLNNEAEPRWPYSYYQRIVGEDDDGSVATQYGVTGHDGGFSLGFGYDWYWRYYWGYRLAPLPWQAGNGELETESEFQPTDGVNEGQFYNLPPQYPCGRYLTTFMDDMVWAALEEAYVAAANEKNKAENGDNAEEIYAFEPISKEVAKTAIVGTILEKATRSYSIDPSLHEERGIGFASGVGNEALLQINNPPPYFTVFSLHLEKEEDRWPHWLALMAAYSPTALLTASSCMCYNDFRPAGGWPEDEPGNLPEEEDDETVTPGEEDTFEGEEDTLETEADTWTPSGGAVIDPVEKPEDGGGVIVVPHGYIAGEGFKSCELVKVDGVYYWKLTLDENYTSQLCQNLNVPAKLKMQTQGFSDGYIANVYIGWKRAGEYHSCEVNSSELVASGVFEFAGTDQDDVSLKLVTHNFEWNNDRKWIEERVWWLKADEVHSAGAFVDVQQLNRNEDLPWVQASQWYKFSVNRRRFKGNAKKFFRKKLKLATFADSAESWASDTVIVGNLSGNATSLQAVFELGDEPKPE